VSADAEQRRLWRMRAEAYLASAAAARDPMTAADLLVLAGSFERMAQFAAALPDLPPDRSTYSTRARECELLATKVLSLEAKESYKRLAAVWRDLAAQLEADDAAGPAGQASQ
jgi:hypothetical protein